MNTSLVVRCMSLFVLLVSPLWWSTAFSAEGPQTFTLDGRIKQAGTTTPILDPSVKIEVHVMDPSRQCVIYAEEQFVNTQTSNGYFNIQVGSNTGAGKRIAGVDPGLAMATVFSNAAAMAGTNVSGQTCPLVLGTPTYTPTTKDARYFRIFVTPSGTAITDTLADVVLDAVPNAIVAENALSAQAVGGVTAANLLQVNTAGGHVLTQSNLDVVFTTSNYSALTALLAGSSTLYNRPASNGTNVIPSIAAPTSPSAGQVWYNAGNILYHDGSTTRTISTGSSSSVSAGAGTAGAPSISFSGDTDTGWYLAGADNLAAATGGVERVRINENGNLGVGSAAPDARLTLGGNMTAPAWTSSGIGIRQNSATYTDSSSSGTVGFNYVNAFGVPTLASSSATTVTDASSFSLYPPVPGTNTTITNSTGLTVNASTLTGVTRGYGMVVNAPTGATNNYAASFMGGNVGFGTTVPSARIHATNGSGSNVYMRVGSGNAFEASNTAASTTTQIQLNAVGDGANFTGLRLLSDEAVDKTWQIMHKASGGSLNRLSFEYYDGSAWHGALNILPNDNILTATTSKVGMGVATPTATLHIKAGSATANTAPIKLTAGPVNTTAEAGAIEFDGTSLFYTDSGNVRRTLGVSGSGITALTGDVTTTGSGSVAATIATSAVTTAKIADSNVTTIKLADDNVTFAKLQNIATQKLVGRSTAATGDAEELGVGTGLTITGGNLNLTDTTDDDSFATLLGVCANGYVPHKVAGAWTCLEATDLLVNSSLVKRDGSGNFAAAQGTLNSLRLNNAGSYVSVNTPLTANYALTLPIDDGTPNQVLQTDGSGVLSWVTSLVSGGTGLFANGTAAAPSISFTNDPNTGFYNPSNDSNVIAASTNGVERMRINETGGVGIGTTVPDAPLAVNGSGSLGNGNMIEVKGTDIAGYSSIGFQTNAGAAKTWMGWGNANTGDYTANAFTISNDSLDPMYLSTNATPRIAILAGGNVGIGTTAPSGKLDVVGDGGTADITTNVYGAAFIPTIRLQKSRGTVAAPVIVNDTDTVMRIQGGGHDGTAFRAATSIRTAIDGTPGANDMPGRLMFDTSLDGTAAPAERMRINNIGQIGIGTTAPTAALHIKAGTTAAGTAPLKLTAGPVNTTAEAGAIEFDGTSLFYTDSGNVRRTLGVSGSGVTALTGDVTTTGSGSVAATIATSAVTTAKIADSNVTTIKLADDNVTFAKLQNIATQTLIGRGTAATGDPEAITLSAGFTITGGALTLTDTTDDDSFATLLGVCANGYVPHRVAGAWTCLEAASANTVSSLVLRDGSGNFTAGTATVTRGLFANGAAATPSISFTNDLNTGFFSPSNDANVIAASVNGVEKMRLDSAGNLGIGTTNPGSPITAAGVIESTSGGFKFPDGSTQTSAGQLAPNALAIYKVRVTTTANITLSGTQTIDSVVVVAGDRVLVRAQTLAQNNGVYVVSAGAWTRATDMDTWAETMGHQVFVTEGAINSLATFVSLSTVGGTLGTTGLYWSGVGQDLQSNVRLGSSTLQKNTGYTNVAIGQAALGNNTTGSFNTALGATALGLNSTGSSNVALGQGAAINSTTGSNNIAIGWNALASNVAKGESVAVGYQAMQGAHDSATIANTFNTAIGAYALKGSGTISSNSGLRNTALGHSALTGVSTGSNNIGLGYNAGSAITTGANNVVIGSDTGSSIATLSNYVLLNDGAGTRRITIDNNGDVGIGATAPASALTVARSNATAYASSGAAYYPSGAANGLYIQNTSNTSNSASYLLFGGLQGGLIPTYAYIAGAYRTNGRASLHFGTGTASIGNYAETMQLDETGHLGVGTTAPTATVHIKAGTTSFSSAPLKLTAGTNMTTPEPGAIEYDGTNLYYTDSTSTRRTLSYASGGITALTGEVTASGTGSVAATITNLAVTTAKIADDNVTFAKLQNIATQKLVGRSTAAAGDAEELGVGTGLTITGGNLNLTDTTDDDSFATLLGVCGNGYVPHRVAGAWTCLEATDLLVNSSLVKRDGSGNFAAAQGTFNSLRLNNAGSYVSVNTPLTANYALTLPIDDGTPNQVLKTDGSGVLSWVTAGVGDFTKDGLVTMTGAFNAADGLVGTPSITFGSDPDTGFYKYGANDLGVAVGGAVMARYNTSYLATYGDKVMVQKGVSTAYTPTSASVSFPAGPALEAHNNNSSADTGAFSRWVVQGGGWQAYMGAITNGASTPSIVIGQQTGASAYNERMRIIANGSVGIGTTAPSQKLDIAGNAGAWHFVGTWGSVADPAFNTGGGQGMFAANSGADLAFANGGVERMTVEANGNVGIGTTSPSELLDIAGVLRVNSSTADAISLANAFDNSIYAASGASANIAIKANGGISLYTGGLGGANIRTTITSTGNVGIGTTAPSAKLTVAGPIVSTPSNIATGGAVDLSLSDTFTLASVGGTTIALSNMVHGGNYTVVVQDTAVRTYTFSGCNTSKFKPANTDTTTSSQTIYNILTVYNGATYDCYITWASGYQ